MDNRREGMALALVLMLIVVTATLTAGAAMLGTNSHLMTQYKERQGRLQAVADAGLEEGRARLNGDSALYPDSNFVVVENGVPVFNAGGDTVPGVVRFTYAGPIGLTTGQYGVYGSVVSVAQAANGDRVIRREEIMQESFARFAYFTNDEGTIGFGGGDQIFGPVHSNDDILIYNSGATFNGPVTTARQITGRQYGTYNSGYREGAARIPMPRTADLNRLRGYAQQGGTALVGSTAGTADQASIIIEFLTVDLNGDGDGTDDDEGFMRVYQATDLAYAMADLPAGGITTSRNCGHFHTATDFVAADDHPSGGHNASTAITSGGRCFPGGHPVLFDGTFNANTPGGGGAYAAWAGNVDARVIAAVGGTEATYLWPLSRQINPNFKGVIFVDGKVAIHGVLRSRITLAATDNIVILDDMTYSVNPGLQTCSDILGLFSGTDIVIADNLINTPYSYSSAWRRFDDTRDEFLHGVVLALSNFRVENHNAGPTSAEPCGSISWGRGCLFLTGGVIQENRGPVGLTSGTGYLKRYSYDQCAFTDPPPYFPTTGRFIKQRVFTVDPVGFTPAALFDLLTPDS
jgi:hypothetical protein